MKGVEDFEAIPYTHQHLMLNLFVKGDSREDQDRNRVLLWEKRWRRGTSGPPGCRRSTATATGTASRWRSRRRGSEVRCTKWVGHDGPHEASVKWTTFARCDKAVREVQRSE